MKKYRAIILGLTVATAFTAGCAKKDNLSRQTEYGIIAGFLLNGNAQAWLGIPYARAPVGDLRWKAPVRTDPWEIAGASDAPRLNRLPPQCPQIGNALNGSTGADGEIIGQEDCLYLNVYAPRYKDSIVPQGSDRLPVLVWIHGGANLNGWSGSYDGSSLAGRHNIVVVTINYRLGPFGWMTHSSLRVDPSNSAADNSGNYALLDMILALDWIKTNISCFGGDPGNVTIAGQSAGGFNVLALLASPLAKGLFHRAVAMSGYMALNPVSRGENYYDGTTATSQYSSRERICRLMVNDGTAATYDAARAKLDSDEIADMAAIASYLKGKTVREILEAYRSDTSLFRAMAVTGYRDGVVIPDGDYTAQITDTAAYPGFSHVPVMLGTTLEETKLFNVKNQDLVAGTTVIDPVYYNALNRYETMKWKYAAVDRLAPLFRAVAGDVYAYRFDWDEEGVKLGTDLTTLLGAFHGVDIPFLFSDFSGRWQLLLATFANYATRTGLSDTMVSYLLAFMKSGNPGDGISGGQVEWTAWDTGSGNKYMVLDTATAPGTGIRMSSEEVTKSSLLKSLAAESDPSLTIRKKCSIFDTLAANGIIIDDTGSTLIVAGDKAEFEGYLGTTCP